MKKRKSLFATYIKIIIVILMLIAVIYIAYHFLNKGYDQTTFETVKTDMLLIQGQTEVIAQKVEIKESKEFIGTKIGEDIENDKIKKLIQKGIIDIKSKEHNYYLLNKNDLIKLGLGELKSNDYYIVDYKKNDVVSVEEIYKQDGSVVFKLSEMN